MVVRFEKLVAVLVVVMATMITGCNSSQYRYSKEEFAKNKHGVVFFDVRSDGVSVPFSIANQETGEVVPEYFIDNWLGLKPTENPDLVLRSLLLEPGTYYIKRIGISSGLSGDKSFYDNNAKYPFSRCNQVVIKEDNSWTGFNPFFFQVRYNDINLSRKRLPLSD